MNKLILTTFSLLLSSFVFSQIITVKNTKVKTFAHQGNVDPFYVISEKKWDSATVCETKYILDLGEKVSKFYKNGVFVSKLPFESVTKKGDTYSITLLDYDLNNPNDWFQTNIIVDQKKGVFLFFWYDDVWDITKVEKSINPIISVN